ncbi:thioesterase family protein [Methylobacterium segetis]|uniref:thioesterase family protein n=1 Tax=Methylobacterium segetis TaxID=2488750 RepID=UPI001045EDB6|nr:thioesterase family protein [Methylobacterium segetis]
MKDVPIGSTGSFTLLVGPQHLASQFKDAILPPVFATPMMVLAMENAALNAVRAFLEPGESAVGTKVEVEHLAATPAGHWVRAEAEVVGVEGRRLRFRVAAYDEAEQVGAGTHERMVVDLDRLESRLASKRLATPVLPPTRE